MLPDRAPQNQGCWGEPRDDTRNCHKPRLSTVRGTRGMLCSAPIHDPRGKPPMVTTSASPANSPTYLPVRQDWLDRRKEPILEPELPIVDPHHHLWDRPGWRYLLDELVADTNSGHNIQATVYVQA